MSDEPRWRQGAYASPDCRKLRDHGAHPRIVEEAALEGKGETHTAPPGVDLITATTVANGMNNDGRR